MSSYLDNLSMFDTITRQKGSAYFVEGRVQIISFTSTRCDASVQGTHAYSVHLEFNANKRLIYYRCSCPCGFPCKHIVAVLLALDQKDGLERGNVKKTSSDFDNASYYLSSISRAKMSRNFRSLESVSSVLKKNLSNFSSDEQKELAIAFFSAAVTVESYDYYYSERSSLVTSALSFIGKAGDGQKSEMLAAYFFSDQYPMQERGLAFGTVIGNEDYLKMGEECFTFIAAKNPEFARRLASESELFARPFKSMDPEFVRFLAKTYPDDVYLPEISEQVKLAVSRSDYETATALLSPLARRGAFDENSVRLLSLIKEKIPLDEYKNIVAMAFHNNDSLSCYFLFRESLSNEEFANQKKNLVSELGSKECRYGVFLFEGMIPCTMEALNKLTPLDIYLLVKNEAPLERSEVLRVAKKSYATSKKSRRSNDSLVYSLLTLSLLNDEELFDELNDDAVKKKIPGNPLLANAYYSISEERGFLEREKLYPYGGLNVSK